jgi:hypothetical protein
VDPREQEAHTRARRDGALVWLAGPLCLAAVFLVAFLVLRVPDEGPGAWLGWALGAPAGLAVLWVLVSALHPAKPERTCPSCGEEGLVRLERDSTRGLACERCGHVDRAASSFLLAEAEGPLEPTVLRERRGRRAAPRGATR